MRDLRINVGCTYADTKLSQRSGRLRRARRSTPRCSSCRATNLERAEARRRPARSPGLRRSAASGLPACSTSMPATPSKYNTGSDLIPKRCRTAYTVVNGRIGIRGPDERWAVELWAQNLFDKDYHAGRVQRAVPGQRHDQRGVEHGLSRFSTARPSCSSRSSPSRGPTALTLRGQVGGTAGSRRRGRLRRRRRRRRRRQPRPARTDR